MNRIRFDIKNALFHPKKGIEILTLPQTESRETVRSIPRDLNKHSVPA